jgi:Tol biopolymer transport system component
VLVKNPENPTQIEFVPIGIGEAVRHDLSPIRMDTACWFPGGASLCVAGHEPGRKTRMYRYTIATRAIEPITEEGSGRGSCSVSPDGRFVFTQGQGGHAIFPVAGGAPRRLDALGPQHRGIGWSPDGASVFAFERGVVPSRVLRIDVESGRADLWMEIRPRRESGLWGINGVALSADGERYVASYPQALSELHLLRGLLPA